MNICFWCISNALRYRLKCFYSLLNHGRYLSLNYSTPYCKLQTFIIVYPNYKLSTIFSFCQLLSTFVNFYHLLSPFVRFCQPLSIVIFCQLSSHLINSCQLMSIFVNSCQFQPAQINFCPLWSIFVDFCQILPTFVNFLQLLLQQVCNQSRELLVQERVPLILWQPSISVLPLSIRTKREQPHKE